MSSQGQDDERRRTTGGTGPRETVAYDVKSGLGRWASLGVSTYLVFGFGTAISLYLLVTVGGDAGARIGMLGMRRSPIGGLTSSSVMGAVAFGTTLVMFLGAGLATGLGLFVGRSVGDGESAVVAGAVCCGNGVLMTALPLVILVYLLLGIGPDGAASSVQLEPFVGAAVGLTLGVSATGAAAAALGAWTTTW